ncbi:MAG: adenylosuccinate synthetase [Clostridia bacterium]|nr:adenylosuccinate synthetase [Clostridia bacterium]
MSVSIVFGGQFGSEGKGKVAHYFAVKEKAKYCVRVGGPNSGHTVYQNGNKIIFRILPTGIIESNVIGIIAPGSYIDLDILKKEMQIAKIVPGKLLIDKNAVVIPSNAKHEESGMMTRIGSTESGTGAAVMMRIKRENNMILAQNCSFLSDYICDTSKVLRHACDRGENVIIEGTQGFGLSLLHSPYYPYTTSRDTSAASFLSETGLSPFDVENIIMVIRTFPIRVSGNSGPLVNETSWNDIQKELKTEKDLTEYTSCTNRIRRVARFDADIVRKSIIVNQPNIIVLNHTDYCCDPQSSISLIEKSINRMVDYIGKSPITLEAK